MDEIKRAEKELKKKFKIKEDKTAEDLFNQVIKSEDFAKLITKDGNRYVYVPYAYKERMQPEIDMLKDKLHVLQNYLSEHLDRGIIV